MAIIGFSSYKIFFWGKDNHDNQKIKENIIENIEIETKDDQEETYIETDLNNQQENEFFALNEKLRNNILEIDFCKIDYIPSLSHNQHFIKFTINNIYSKDINFFMLNDGVAYTGVGEGVGHK